MDYQSYLFSKLLCEFSVSFDNLPYDIQFGAHENLLGEFQGSGFNCDDVGEYVAMHNFLFNIHLNEPNKLLFSE